MIRFLAAAVASVCLYWRSPVFFVEGQCSYPYYDPASGCTLECQYNGFEVCYEDNAFQCDPYIGCTCQTMYGPYYGMDCNIPCDCNGMGMCNQYTGVCKCSLSTWGSHCQYSCPTYNNLVCNNHGICYGQDLNINGTCYCSSGYSGTACQNTATLSLSPTLDSTTGSATESFASSGSISETPSGFTTRTNTPTFSLLNLSSSASRTLSRTRSPMLNFQLWLRVLAQGSCSTVVDIVCWSPTITVPSTLYPTRVAALLVSSGMMVPVNVTDRYPSGSNAMQSLYNNFTNISSVVRVVLRYPLTLYATSPLFSGGTVNASFNERCSALGGGPLRTNAQLPPVFSKVIPMAYSISNVSFASLHLGRPQWLASAVGIVVSALYALCLAFF